jgi:hypothetical protein
VGERRQLKRVGVIFYDSYQQCPSRSTIDPSIAGFAIPKMQPLFYRLVIASYVNAGDILATDWAHYRCLVL